MNLRPSLRTIDSMRTMAMLPPTRCQNQRYPTMLGRAFRALVAVLILAAIAYFFAISILAI